MRKSTQNLSVAAAVAALLTAGGIALAQNTTPPADTKAPLDSATTAPSTTTPNTTTPSERTPRTVTNPTLAPSPPSSSTTAPMDSNRAQSALDGTLETRADRN